MSKIDKLIARLSVIKEFSALPEILEIETRETFAINGNHHGEIYLIISHTDISHSIKIADIQEVIEVFEPNKYFWVRNVKRVAFVPLDGKRGLIKSQESRCDAIIFDEFVLCFIEFKTEATSLEDRAIRKNRKGAIKQIAQTIILFNEKLGNDYEGLAREAYICTPTTYPRNNADWLEKRVAFLEEFGIELFESNEKICK